MKRLTCTGYKRIRGRKETALVNVKRAPYLVVRGEGARWQVFTRIELRLARHTP
jgi:hypothetical protein